MTPTTVAPLHKLCLVGGAPNAHSLVLSRWQVCFLDTPCRHMQLHPHNSATNGLVSEYLTYSEKLGKIHLHFQQMEC